MRKGGFLFRQFAFSPKINHPISSSHAELTNYTTSPTHHHHARFYLSFRIHIYLRFSASPPPDTLQIPLLYRGKWV